MSKTGDFTRRFRWMPLATAACAAAVLVAPIAQADVMGSAYSVSEAASQNAVIGGSYGTAEATFTVPTAACGTAAQDLCFSSAVGGYTLGGFLGSGGATNIVGSSSALSANIDNGSMGLILEFTGDITVTTGESFNVAHDDGLQLMIGSDLVVNAPGPTSPVVTPYTYTGPSGTYSFDLVYGECCGPPAVLSASLPLAVSTPVPEPSTLALLAVGLLGLGFTMRRRSTDG